MADKALKITPLNKKQELFCDYKMEGLSNNDAARMAGYLPNDRGIYYGAPIRSIAIQRELAIRSNDELLNMVPMVIETLKKLLKSKNETVRLAAARDLADRLGLGKDKTNHQNLQVNINLGNSDIKATPLKDKFSNLTVLNKP